jgi:hypothetical protein
LQRLPWRALALLSLAAIASGAAQDPQPPVAQLSPPVLRIPVLMIQVDAVVTGLMGGGMISLGSILSPGEYLVQVVVTDENAGPKKPPVAQWVDFEVVAARDSL